MRLGLLFGRLKHMGRITSTVGLVSGINSGDIIDKLMQLESTSKNRLQSRVNSITAQKDAFSDLMGKLQGIKTTAMLFERPSTFQASSTSSSNENVLTATAGNGAPVGSYQFQVSRMVSTQQAISAGFASADSKVGAGTLTLALGGGGLTTHTELAQLNGGAGVRGGKFRITDRAGRSTVIDSSGAVTLDDLVNKINSSVDINVRATVGNDGLSLTDLSGASTMDLQVQDLGDGHTAADLGLAGRIAGTTLNGTRINTLGRQSALSSLNDGRGVRGGSANDLVMTLADASVVNVSLSSASTLGAALDAINTAGGGKVIAAIAADGHSLQLTDQSGGGGTMSVASGADSHAAEDLGIAGSASGGSINGAQLTAGLNSVLLSSLRGGGGITLGQMRITDRSGAGATVDLAGAVSLKDVLGRINNAPGLRVKASISGSDTGIQLEDTSGGGGALTIADLNGSSSATELGIAGTFNAQTPIVSGSSLHRAWMSGGTALSQLNGNKGVSGGKFRILNSNGFPTTIDLGDSSSKSIGDVIKAINNRAAGVSASINSAGNGLLLTDTSGGPMAMKVEEVDGTTAKDLNLLSPAVGTTVDGAFEKTLTLDANDTLSGVQDKINNMGFAVMANVVNDGSPGSPYRLSLTARGTGKAGGFTFDAGGTALATHNLVDAQDAVVFLGSADSAQQLRLTSSTNQITNVIRGVTIDLHGVSASPVNLSITRDVEPAVKQVQSFVDAFNEVTGTMTALTAFDSDTKKQGLLLGDQTIQRIQTALYASMNTVVSSAGKFKLFSDVGIKIGDKATLEFDADKFRSAYGTDPDAVGKLFTTVDSGLGASLEKQLVKLTDPVSGVVTRQKQTLDARSTQFQERIKLMDSQLTDKRTRLQKQFANMESILSGLQSQQQALGSMQSASYGAK